VLKRAVIAEGIQLYENSPATSFDIGTRIRVQTESGSVSAQNCIITTHSPIWGSLTGTLSGLSLSHFQLTAKRTYVLSAKLKTPTLLDGIYWDLAHPYHYLRTMGDELWVGGMDHKTGHSEHTGKDVIRQLEDYTRTRFEVDSISQSWSGQILESHDGLPLVGASLRSKHILFATGFGGNGISMASLAASELCNIALGNHSELGSLLSPHRLPGPMSWAFLAKQNLGYLRNQVESRVIPSHLPDPSTLAPGEACIGKQDGKQVALSRTESGELCAVSGHCTHLGAALVYNEFEKTWDCPCHGSRFSREGKVICGPATKDLEPVAIETKKAA